MADVAELDDAFGVVAGDVSARNESADPPEPGYLADEIDGPLPDPPMAGPGYHLRVLPEPDYEQLQREADESWLAHPIDTFIDAGNFLLRRSADEADRAWAVWNGDNHEEFIEHVQRLRDELRRAAPANDLITKYGARALGDISRESPMAMLINRLDPEGHTILYGDGGVGKGTVTAWHIVQLVRLGHRVLIVDYENHPTEWARRIFGLGGLEALAGVMHVAPLTAAWGGVRGPLWVQAAELRAIALEFGITYMFIDSIVPACAGFDPLKPEAAALYAGGLELIGLPACSLAHATKAGDLRYPFGSAFWHHLARTTWSMKRDGQRAILTHRKHNNYEGLGRFVVVTTWFDDLPREVSEQGYSQALADRIDDVLGDHMETASSIAKALNADREEDEDEIPVDSVRKALNRGIRATPRVPQRYTVEGTGENALYSRVAS